jgi:transcriptional regulator with XRE-family HTH domain
MAGRQKKAPDDSFYRDLGSAIRLARIAAGKSQSDAAAHLDLSFQQIQKYEKGVNRIPVEDLVSLADFLEVPVIDLIDASGNNEQFKSIADKFRAKGFSTLLESWGAIKDQHMRAAILDFIKSAAAFSRR